MDPAGGMVPGDSVPGSVNGGPLTPLRVASLTEFYWIQLDSAEAAAYSVYAETAGDDIGLGNQTDSASLAAMILRRLHQAGLPLLAPAGPEQVTCGRLKAPLLHGGS